MKKREGINLSIDISVTNANDNDATPYHYQTDKHSETNPLQDNTSHNSKTNQNNNNNTNSIHSSDELCTSQTTFRAEGLSIGMDYMRFEGSTFSRSLSSHHLVIERTLGRGAFSIVQLARLKRNNWDHDHNFDSHDEFGVVVVVIATLVVFERKSTILHRCHRHHRKSTMRSNYSHCTSIATFYHWNGLNPISFTIAMMIKRLTFLTIHWARKEKKTKRDEIMIHPNHNPSR